MFLLYISHYITRKTAKIVRKYNFHEIFIIFTLFFINYTFTFAIVIITKDRKIKA